MIVKVFRELFTLVLLVFSHLKALRPVYVKNRITSWLLEPINDGYDHLYIYIYIVIHRQICFVLSELISVARQYLPVAGIETRLTQTSNTKLLTIQPREDFSYEVNFKRLWITITIVYIHPFNGSRDLNSTTKRLAIDANGNTITSSPENSTPRG